jgi:hypothetical protein
MADAAMDVIADEANERTDTDTSPFANERKRIEGEIKKLYYSDANGIENSYHLKHQIHDLIDEFEAIVSGNGGEGEDLDLPADDLAEDGEEDVPLTMENFADDQMEVVEEAVGDANGQVGDAAGEAMDAMNEAANDQMAAMNGLIDDKVMLLDERIAEKTQAICDAIDILEEDFIIIFWEAVTEIYEQIGPYEKQGLIWRALFQKDAFFQEAAALKQMLVEELDATRTNLVDQLNTERDNMTDMVVDMRDEMTGDVVEMVNDMAEVIEDMEEALVDDAKE